MGIQNDQNKKKTIFIALTALSLLSSIFLGIMSVAPVFGDPELSSFYQWLVYPADHRALFVAILATAATLGGMGAGFLAHVLKKQK